MFAILAGTNTGSLQYQTILEDLCAVAAQRGFRAGEDVLPIQQDQIPLGEWSLSLRGPAGGHADFLLAVTAPKSPGICPIPVMKTVSGPLFAVVMMDSCYVVWREGAGDCVEFVGTDEVVQAFRTFLDLLPKQG